MRLHAATRWFVLALAVLPVAACSSLSPKDWQDGLPPVGKSLSNDQRVHYQSKFAVYSFNTEQAVIHVGHDDVHYRLASYRPVMDDLDPTIYQHVEAMKYPTWALLATTLGSTMTADAASRHPSRSRAQIAGYAATAVLLGAGALLAHYIDYHLTNALTLYKQKLDERLFGTGTH